MYCINVCEGTHSTVSIRKLLKERTHRIEKTAGSTQNTKWANSNQGSSQSGDDGGVRPAAATCMCDVSVLGEGSGVCAACDGAG